ncbi:MAG: hypothetical protein LC643_03350 [Bacteroidales bacterium]|nr:hypothetical protein [Bacteroidales bacterium]
MEKTRVAIIDLGTNTFNLLITEVVDDTYRILVESKYPARLGEGGIHKATITNEAMKRGVEALTTHLITISEYQVESIFCFATSAIRDLGVARLLEQFPPSDPILPKEIQIIEKHLEAKLQSLIEAVDQFPICKLIGSSGSFDTLATIIAKKEYPLIELSKITSFNLEAEALNEVHQQLIGSTIEGRRTIPGMDPDRVENIVPASIIVQWVLQRLQPKEVWQCAFALKEGAILQIINNVL